MVLVPASRMKRVILLILSLLLLSDMVEDSGVGKVTYVISPSAPKTFHTSYLKDCSGEVDSLKALPSADGDLASPRELQTPTLELQQALKIINVTHIGSSGGIPP